jgi:hypothetical protein
MWMRDFLGAHLHLGFIIGAAEFVALRGRA